MSRGVGVAVAAGLLFAIVVGAGIWLWPRGAGSNDVELTPAELHAAVTRADRAVGLLENEAFDDAIPEFEGLRETLPDSPFPSRNLAVARLGRVERKRDLYDEAEGERIRAALDDESDDATEHVLLAQLAQFAGRTADQIAQLERAAELAPDDPAIQVELWQATVDAGDPTLAERGERALARAGELAPDNLYVLSKLLLVQGQARRPELIETVRAAQRVLAPIASSIEARAHVDVVEYLKGAETAIEAGEWQQAAARVKGVHNVMQSEPAYRGDAMRVDRDLLSFVIDVPAELRERAEQPDAAEPVSVRFTASDALLPEVAGNVEAIRLVDVDLDGRLELAVLTGERLSLFTRNERGAFVELTSHEVAGFVDLLALDFDTDAVRAPAEGPPGCQVADPDFVLWGPAGVLVLENRTAADDATRQLVPVESDGSLNSLRAATACTAADFDHDGDLDLVVASAAGLSLHAGRGDLTFEDTSAQSMLPADLDGAITSIVPVDVDADLDVDFVVTGPKGSAGWLENLRHGNLRWRADDSCAVGEAVAVVDDTSHRGWRLLAIDGVSLHVLPVNGDPAAEALLDPVHDAADVPADSKTVVADFDNDGLLDVVAAGVAGAILSRQTATGTFTADDDAFGPVQGTTAIDFGDLDGDGDLDLVVAGDDGLRVLDNEGGNTNHWLRLGLRAQQIRDGSEVSSGRVNQNGVGSLVETRIGPEWHRRIVRRPWTHLGLGPHDEVDTVRILWTNGVPQNIVGATGNAVACEVQSLKGSCPYLYTWDGERFVFFTDLLWASPIGLQFADGVIAKPRAWEHLRLPGDRLVPRDGFHELRITEELWEVGYFDSVELIAVDHPAEAAVYTNEKVGPPSVAEHRLHTITSPRRPVAIRDGDGRDLLPELGERDEVYGTSWQRRLRQGLVEEHVLEIDLGELGDPRQITLFLTGWVFPSDTSINVALSHDPRFPSPRPPSLQVPNERGEWTTVVPYTGFPGGKTKTIALDLSDVFPTADHRVRLVTNMEFYWDQVFLTVDEPMVPTRETSLELATAELRFRGFSRESLPTGLGPHSYDYEDVSTVAKWPPIGGGGGDVGFTRYGDVSELVAEEDDRLVILGPGDEMVLRFRVPDGPPPAGWTRDYVLRNVGWDKDADLNTIAGQTVGPLPFRGMSDYPYAGEVERPNAAVLNSDLLRFHVRRQPRGAFWNPQSDDDAKP